jgi:hypothetical protein
MEDCPCCDWLKKIIRPDEVPNPCNSLDLKNINFEYKKTNEKIYLYLIGRGNSSEIILKDIKEEDAKFIHILNEIKNQFGKINEKKLIALKESLKAIIPQIYEKKIEIENYKELIDKSTINNLDFKRVNYFCDIFISFYKKKKEINGNYIICFMVNLENALKETDILNKEEFEYFFNKLKEILSNKSNDEEKNNNINMEEKSSEQALISDDEQNSEREIDVKKIKNSIKSAPLLPSKYEYFKNLDLQSKKQNKSNVSHSENSEKYEKKISFLEMQNKIKDKRIIELEEEIKKYKNVGEESNLCSKELEKTEANNYDNNTRCFTDKY